MTRRSNRQRLITGGRELVGHGVVAAVAHLATTSRGLMHGDVAMSDVVYVLVATAVITAVFAPIALRMYHRER